ncbi:MAG TPA: class I SAM-dependent methyltransferase [Jatrophihabitans sp.]|jgi:cyclopropane-fatty-acyl-phospholipid synthase|uniref:class I SAM-dependent methyltransferase n=1 Tax=Jatrophihabitans sp. TaxID=1932789 RepID=UPI002F1487B2
MAIPLTVPTLAKAPAEDNVAKLIGVLERLNTAGSVECFDGTRRLVGGPDPVWHVRFRTEAAQSLPLNEFALGQAYIAGEIDLDGDLAALLDVRSELRKGITVPDAAAFAYRLMLRSPTKVNAASIAKHYTLGDDFYLNFIDRRYRYYSHCLFHHERETLEEAAEHKLESMWNALELKPGMRLLDIGGGWGGTTQYCGDRGVEVTSLTLVEESAAYIRRLIGDRGIPGRVIVQDLLDHRPAEPYDHAVIYGVIEHIPNYRTFCDRVWSALKPGGRLYLDASATKQKFAMSPFSRQFTWPGHHTFLSLQDMTRELLWHGFEIVEVKRETYDYELTIQHWADRFEASHDFVARRWGEEVYRAFRMFLRGGQHAFRTNRLQAYHLVAERREDPGPRPGALMRAADFIGSLR